MRCGDGSSTTQGMDSSLANQGRHLVALGPAERGPTPQLYAPIQHALVEQHWHAACRQPSAEQGAEVQAGMRIQPACWEEACRHAGMVGHLGMAGMTGP